MGWVVIDVVTLVGRGGKYLEIIFLFHSEYTQSTQLQPTFRMKNANVALEFGYLANQK